MNDVDAEIFVCYWENDVLPIRGRFLDHLRREFGQKNVISERDLPAGAHVMSDSLLAMLKSKILLLLISQKWVDDSLGKEVTDSHPKTNADLITSIALNTDGLRRIPILVDGVSLEAVKDNLSHPLLQLSYLRPMILRGDPDFNRDMERIIGVLQYYGVTFKDSSNRNRLPRFRRNRNNQT